MATVTARQSWSCGREQFGQAFAQLLLRQVKARPGRSADLIRTVTLLTPLSIVAAFHRWVFPALHRARRGQAGCDLVLSGGGAHNPLIRAQLEAALAAHRIRLLTSGELAVPEDGKEAFAFAVLAYETWRQRPSNLPTATGARHPAILGKICYASR